MAGMRGASAVRASAGRRGRKGEVMRVFKVISGLALASALFAGMLGPGSGAAGCRDPEQWRR